MIEDKKKKTGKCLDVSDLKSHTQTIFVHRSKQWNVWKIHTLTVFSNFETINFLPAHIHTQTLLTLNISSFFLPSSQDNRRSIRGLASAVYNGDGDSGGDGDRRERMISSVL